MSVEFLWDWSKVDIVVNQAKANYEKVSMAQHKQFESQGYNNKSECYVL